MNRRRLSSTILAVATLLVVWLVVSPASAMTRSAPLCDPRGLIGFAPPPQLQDLELSLDVPPDCVESSPIETRNFVPGHRAPPLDVSTQEPVAQTAVWLPPAPATERLGVRADAEGRPPPGFRTSIDRPPRA